MKGELEMKIVRTEEGKYTRTTTLELDKEVVEVINHNLSMAIVNGVECAPLTVEEVWDILTNSIKAVRYNEEYFIEYYVYTGNMKLGDFVRCEINEYFEEMPCDETEETPDLWYDEFHP